MEEKLEDYINSYKIHQLALRTLMATNKNYEKEEKVLKNIASGAMMKFRLKIKEFIDLTKN